jgi:hypothetical protein
MRVSRALAPRRRSRAQTKNLNTGDSMFQTKVTFSEDQTPEQRKAQVAMSRKQDDRRRAMNNALGFWRICSKPICRRNHACSHDMHACFQRHWWPIPEDQKEWLRGALVATYGGATGDAVLRAADARRAEYLQFQERINAGAAPAASSPSADRGDAAPRVEARIRRL